LAASRTGALHGGVVVLWVVVPCVVVVGGRSGVYDPTRDDEEVDGPGVSARTA